VLAFADIVDANVDFTAAGHLAGEFFAHEEIREPAQRFRTFDGIVVSEGEEGHPPALQTSIDFFGGTITFAAKLSDNRGRTWSGVVRVNMQVAFHESEFNFVRLRGHDKRANV